MLSHNIDTHKTIEKHLEMNIPDPVSDLLLLSLPRHPLQCEVQLSNPTTTKYERKTVTSVDWRTPIQPDDVMLIALNTAFKYNHIHELFQENTRLRERTVRAYQGVQNKRDAL